MLGFGAVALCFPLEQRMSLLTPLIILLGFSGVTRLIFGAWFFQKGSTWRRLVQQSALVDLLAGGVALLMLYQHNYRITLLLGLWFTVSGYFQIRRYDFLRHQCPGCTPAGLTGALSIIAGVFLFANELVHWVGAPLDLSAPLIIIGLFKIYAFIKLGRIHRRSFQEEAATKDAFAPYAPLNLN